jgi:hypothetical protein
VTHSVSTLTSVSGGALGQTRGDRRADDDDREGEESLEIGTMWGPVGSIGETRMRYSLHWFICVLLILVLLSYLIILIRLLKII